MCIRDRLMIGVFGAGTRLVSMASVVVAAITLVLIWLEPEGGVAFSGLFVKDPFGDFMKTLVMIGSGAAIVMSIRYIEHEGMARFEFPVLMLFATVGMLMMISANDLMSLYVGLEIQSLALYVIAAFRRDALRSSEAGLKYFVLGALSSGCCSTASPWSTDSLARPPSPIWQTSSAAARCRSASLSAWSS